MKKIFVFIFAIICSLTLVFATGCDGFGEVKFDPVNKEDVKIGMICLHDLNSTYDANFILSMYTALENLGMSRDQLKLFTGIDESEDCYNKAVELAQSCNVVFADSFGHEDFMIQAAKEYKNVRFCHATGEKAHLVNLNNFSNAFASIYQGRFLAGIAAGMKLNEMNNGKAAEEQNWKIGYVGAYPYAEVVSGYTSFYLGAKYVAPKVTMEVRYTSSWFDFAKEQAACNALIANGCALISQHADSMGAPEACETAKVPNVTYNGSTASACPETYIVSSKIDWAPYFEYMINCVISGEKIATDWTGTIETGSVKLDSLGKNAASGTYEKIEEVKAKLVNGTLHVFDLSTFTVGGVTLNSVMANVDFDEAYTPDHEAVKDGYFDESALRSAPYFELRIDGITEISDKAN